MSDPDPDPLDAAVLAAVAAGAHRCADIARAVDQPPEAVSPRLYRLVQAGALAVTGIASVTGPQYWTPGAVPHAHGRVTPPIRMPDLTC